MSKRGPDRGGDDGFNKRRSHGKPMIKMLCPFYCAGAIIGKGGETIKELMNKTECDVKISKNDERFPSTSERVVSIQGDHSAVEECVLFSQDKIRKDQPPPNAKSESHAINAKRKESCKLVVSNTSAGRIIGKGGQRIKDMKTDFNVRIDITRTEELPRGFDERVVSIEGEEGNVDNCAKEIVKLVCEDESASMEWHIFYNDWSERRDDRDGGFNSRDNFGGGGGSGGRRDSFSREPIHDDRERRYEERPRGGYEERKGGYERESYGGSGGGGGGGYDRERDSGRGYRDEPRGGDRGYTERSYGDRGGESNRGGKESYGGGARDAYRDDRDMGGYRDSGRDGYRDGGMDRREEYSGGRDGFSRSGAGRDGFSGERDNRDRSSMGTGGGGFGGGERRSYRDEPRGGSRY